MPVGIETQVPGKKIETSGGFALFKVAKEGKLKEVDNLYK